MRILIRAKVVYAPGFPDADSLLIEDELISWVGQYSVVKNLGLTFDGIIDVSDCFVAPAFVDSHVHLSATGAMATGLDLRETQSATEALAKLISYCEQSSDKFIIGQGWDDTHWTDRELWSLESVDSKLKGRNLYLSRIDYHSALVATPALSGLVYKNQHHEVRKFVQDAMPTEQRRSNIKAALTEAAAMGVVSVHENGGPAVSGRADFLDVLEISKSDLFPEVVPYWGSTDLDEVLELKAFGAAGDLTVDGSIGSKTALLTECYCSTSDDFGTAFLSTEEIAQHLISCSKIGIQGGFHAIGDEALTRVVQGFQLAKDEIGTELIRTNRHRVEHAELLDLSELDFLHNLGVVLSMQPVFDELWGAAGGLYEQRLGIDRSSTMNAFAQIAQTGITMAFSSDSPVTPIDPWRAISAAINHNQPQHRISARAAFNAHTRGGWRAAKNDVSGVIEEGAPAHIAIWDVKEFSVSVPDNRVRAWSTDERSGTPPLPDLSDEKPVCIATIRNGRPIFDPNNLFGSV